MSFYNNGTKYYFLSISIALIYVYNFGKKLVSNKISDSLSPFRFLCLKFMINDLKFNIWSLVSSRVA